MSKKKFKPKIHILLSAVGDVFPNNWKEKPTLLSELTEKALTAWESRQPTDKTVRFMHKLPAKYGILFRFFTVTRQDDGSLLVSKGGSNE